MDEHAEVGTVVFYITFDNTSPLFIFHKLSSSLPRTQSMEDNLPTNNCPADPEDQEEEELLQIPGQNLIGLPKQEIANFSLQCDPQAQVDSNFEAM